MSTDLHAVHCYVAVYVDGGRGNSTEMMSKEGRLGGIASKWICPVRMLKIGISGN